MPYHATNAQTSAVSIIGTAHTGQSADVPTLIQEFKAVGAQADQRALDLEHAQLSVSRDACLPYRRVGWLLVEFTQEATQLGGVIKVGQAETASVSTSSTVLGLPKYTQQELVAGEVIRIGNFTVGETVRAGEALIALPPGVVDFAAIADDSAMPTLMLPRGAGVDLRGGSIAISGETLGRFARADGTGRLWLRNVLLEDDLFVHNFSAPVGVPRLTTPDATATTTRAVWTARQTGPAIGPTLRAFSGIVDGPCAAGAETALRVVQTDEAAQMVCETGTYVCAGTRDPVALPVSGLPIWGVEVVTSVYPVEVQTVAGPVEVATQPVLPTTVQTAAGPRLRFPLIGKPEAQEAFWEAADVQLTQSAVQGVAIPTAYPLLVGGQTIMCSPAYDLLPIVTGRPTVTIQLTGEPGRVTSAVNSVIDVLDLGGGTSVCLLVRAEEQTDASPVHEGLSAVSYVEVAPTTEFGEFASLLPR